jgi:hypothetical protein
MVTPLLFTLPPLNHVLFQYFEFNDVPLNSSSNFRLHVPEIPTGAVLLGLGEGLGVGDGAGDGEGLGAGAGAGDGAGLGLGLGVLFCAAT